MLKEMLNAVEEHLRDALNPVNATKKIFVARYKNEFEDGADWNPKFPCVLYRLKYSKPSLRSMSGEVVKNEIGLTLYCADRDINSPAGLDVIDSVIDATDNVMLEYFDSAGHKKEIELELSDEGIELHGYTTQVEVYRMDIIIRT